MNHELGRKRNRYTCAVLVVPYLLPVSDIRHEEQAMNRTCNMNLKVEKHVRGDACQDSEGTQQWLSTMHRLGDWYERQSIFCLQLCILARIFYYPSH